MTFFDKYSFKQKNIALAVFSVLLIAAAYKKAFSITIETKKYSSELQEKMIRQNDLYELGLFVGGGIILVETIFIVSTILRH